jgi:hypothetical protein
MSTGTPLAFKGTHRIVYGWVPPSGLPVAVLEALRDALLDAYADACWEELNVSRRSAQTSPILPNFEHAPVASAWGE